MDSLFRFIVKHHLFLTFILLEIFAVQMVLRTSTFKNSIIAEQTEIVEGNIKSVLSEFKNYLFLNQRTSELTKSNSDLIAENLHLKALLNLHTIDYVFDTLMLKQKLIHARVVENTLNRKHNMLMLDVGKKQGVDKDMGVISSDGIVGIVDRASENFCTVVSLLNPSKEINAKLKKSGLYGPLIWNGKNIGYTEMVDIPQHVSLEKGDSIITSGHSLIFPEGIFIGIADTFYIDKGTSYKIKVKLNNDFKSLYNVFVIKDFDKQEFDSIRNIK